jgi:pimeloyl-ACP methyl ester carboxylesterase
LDITAKLEIYKHGPSDWHGDDSATIQHATLLEILRVYEAQATKPKIAIFGFSRGAMISLWLANSLAERGIQVDIVLLMDPVDMTTSIPDSAAVIQNGVKKVVVFGPSLNSQNKDHINFTRMSEESRIHRAPNNSSTDLKHVMYDASHGALGGSPGFNDEEEGINYNYPVDRQSSIAVHQQIVSELRSVGIDVHSVEAERFGFPLNNPVSRM